MSDSDQRRVANNWRRFVSPVRSGRATQPVVKIRRLVSFPRKALPAFLAITIALSFLTTLIPIADASLNANTMECCVGKAGHCDSGIEHKKIPPPKSEPTCGLHGAELDDGITLVAQSPQPKSHISLSQAAETDSSRTAAESTSIHKPCQMDCAACAGGSTRQQNRERGLAEQIQGGSVTLTAQPGYNEPSDQFSSSGNWSPSGIRGPPASSNHTT